MSLVVATDTLDKVSRRRVSKKIHETIAASRLHRHLHHGCMRPRQSLCAAGKQKNHAPCRVIAQSGGLRNEAAVPFEVGIPGTGNVGFIDPVPMPIKAIWMCRVERIDRAALALQRAPHCKNPYRV